MKRQWNHKIFNLTAGDFNAAAREIFQYQYDQNSLYRDYVDAIHLHPADVRDMVSIPFLPIRFFKSHTVLTGGLTPSLIFESSGTTGAEPSRHFVSDPQLYLESFGRGFERAYGPVTDYCVLGLLPSYLERGNSSLVYMVDQLIKASGHPASGFYLDEFDRLSSVIRRMEAGGQKTLLIGVTFALLDFAAAFPQPLKHTIVMETGGMKGRRREMIREEVHAILRQAFDVPHIHSEYGMTELLSQAYSKGDGRFQCPPWMKILLRDEEDPLNIRAGNDTGPVSGAINIIDLANVHSCSFIATDDAGRLYPDGIFEVLGRMDNSDIRGCSLLAL